MDHGVDAFEERSNRIEIAQIRPREWSALRILRFGYIREDETVGVCIGIAEKTPNFTGRTGK